MGLEEIGINAGNWIDPAQDRDYRKAFVSEALIIRIPWAMFGSYFDHKLTVLTAVYVQGNANTESENAVV